MRIRDLSISLRRHLSPQGNQTQNDAQKLPREVSERAAARTDAVIVDQSLRSRQNTGTEGVDRDRQSKLDTIKRKVRDGAYEVDKDAVAVALIRDLGL